MKPGARASQDAGGAAAPQKAARQRIDKWLFFARVTKSRTLAASLVEGGHVRVNGQRMVNPARGLLPGDVLTIALAHQVRVLRVAGFGARRGSFPEASQLYEDLVPPGGAQAD